MFSKISMLNNANRRPLSHPSALYAIASFTAEPVAAAGVGRLGARLSRRPGLSLRRLGINRVLTFIVTAD